MRQNKKKSIFYSVSALLLVLILSTGIACAPAVPEPAPDSTQYEEYRSLAMSILSGEKLDRLSFDPAGDQLYFGFEGDHFCSYTDAKFDDDDYERGYFSDSDPVETYPRSLGEEAQRAIARERNAAFPDYGFDPEFKARMYGYAGEGWVVLSNGDDLMHDEAVTCVFLRGLDGSWHEIGNNNSVFPRALKGACMLSDREGYLCFGDRYFDPDGGAARKLHIFIRMTAAKIGQMLASNFRRNMANQTLSSPARRFSMGNTGSFSSPHILMTEMSSADGSKQRTAAQIGPL